VLGLNLVSHLSLLRLTNPHTPATSTVYTQAPPPPALINADLICRAPDNVLLLVALLRPEPEGCEDFYVRYGALQTLNGLLRACPDKLQVCRCLCLGCVSAAATVLCASMCAPRAARRQCVKLSTPCCMRPTPALLLRCTCLCLRATAPAHTCAALCCPVQACVLSSPLGVTALMDLLSQPLEVLRNEALLLLVGLCSGCPQIANIAAFEGAFEKLLAICGAEGGPGGGDVIVQDAAELINNMLRDNLANQRLFRWASRHRAHLAGDAGTGHSVVRMTQEQLGSGAARHTRLGGLSFWRARCKCVAHFDLAHTSADCVLWFVAAARFLLLREMGHINQLPGLLVYSPPAAATPSAAAGIFSSASQYMDPSLRAAAGAAANAAANSVVGAAAAAAVAAAGAAASAWPVQVAANYLCLLETARVLLAAPHSPSGDQQAQVGAMRVCSLFTLTSADQAEWQRSCWHSLQSRSQKHPECLPAAQPQNTPESLQALRRLTVACRADAYAAVVAVVLSHARAYRSSPIAGRIRTSSGSWGSCRCLWRCPYQAHPRLLCGHR
jgi:hypothetical protein